MELSISPTKILEDLYILYHLINFFNKTQDYPNRRKNYRELIKNIGTKVEYIKDYNLNYNSSNLDNIFYID